MTRKRGFDNVYERLENKKRSLSSFPRTPSNTVEVKNSLNEELLNLYRQQTMKPRKESLNAKDVEMPEVTNKDTGKFKNNTVETMTAASLNNKRKNSGRGVTIKYPKINLDSYADNDDLIDEIFHTFNHFFEPRPDQELNLKPERGCLFYGPPGCGKTHLVRAIAGDLEVPLIEIAASYISAESGKEIRESFDEAIKLGRCILFIDKVDIICPNTESTDDGMKKRVAKQLIECLDELNEKDACCNVMLIGETNDRDSIDPTLRGGGRFDQEFAVGIPNEKTRLQILQILCKDVKVSLDFNLSWIAHRSAGYVGADLKILLQRAAKEAKRRFYIELSESSHALPETNQSFASKIRARLRPKNIPEESLKKFCLEMKDIEGALKKYVPYCKREGFPSVPEVTWEDVGALQNVKKELQLLILDPVKDATCYEENSISPIKGILLCGPKGCGKTLMAKALANECNLNFLSVQAGELLNKYLGESERAIRKCFERARNAAPCVIFFDEFDALCSSRSSSDDNAAAARVVNQLLTEMDGTQERKQVFVIAATNRIEKIDSAMRRPGRLERVIYIDVPSPAGRVDILRSLTKNKTKPKISEDLSLETIAFDQRCQGFSGADLAGLVRGAFIEAKKEKNSQNNSEKLILNKSHFDKAFEVVKPSIREEDRKYFEEFRLQQMES